MMWDWVVKITTVFVFKPDSQSCARVQKQNLIAHGNDFFDITPGSQGLLKTLVALTVAGAVQSVLGDEITIDKRTSKILWTCGS